MSPFLDPAWAIAVGAVRPQTRVVVASDGERWGFLLVEPTGHGDAGPAAGTLSDRQAPIGAVDLLELVRGAGLVRWRFDHLDLERLPGGASTPCLVVTTTAPSPVIDLDRELPATSLVPKVRRFRRRLAQEFGELRFVPRAVGAEREEVLRHLMRWKSAQYLASGAPDLFAERWVHELLDVLSPASGAVPDPVVPGEPEFGECCSALFAGERLVAAHLGLATPTTWHYWLPAYDREVGAHSPGMVLLLEIVEHARSTGRLRVDLGRGDESYKQRLATTDAPVAKGALVVPGLRATFRRRWARTVTRW